MGTSPTSTPRPRLHGLTDRLEGVAALDAVGDRLAAAVKSAIPHGPVKDLLSGTWLGHPLHPLLTDATIAFSTSSLLLDFWGGRKTEAGADRLLAAGIVSALPTAASGASDWSDTIAGARRAGLVHAAANSVALAAWVASYAARRQGNRRRGKLLALAGGGSMGMGAYLGGHLAYSRGVGVNQTAFDEGPAEWTRAAALEDLPEGRPVCVEVAGAALMLVRHGDRVHALANRCTHRGGSLDEGRLEGMQVTCPLHGSTFRIDDGSIVSGPASAPQPAFETRVVGGEVELRLREPHRGRVPGGA